MALHRSPNCPQISFTEAVTKGRKVYDKEHNHPAPKAAVAEDLGYSGINGRALSIIGALRQYAILEGSSEALRITDDAVTYFVAEDGPERNEALRRMIFAPPFFESLRNQFGETLPSVGTLKHHLIKEGFLPKAADEVIGVYRENLELVKNMPKRYIEASTELAETRDNTMTTAISQSAHSSTSAPSMVSPSIYSFSYPLSADTKADLQIRGVVSTEELEMLRDHIEMTIKALQRSSKSKSDVSSQSEG